MPAIHELAALRRLIDELERKSAKMAPNARAAIQRSIENFRRDVAVLEATLSTRGESH